MEKICFDRYIPNDPRRAITASRAAFQISKLWRTGQDIKIAFMEGTEEQKNKVKQAANLWLPHINLQFVWDAADPDIRIAFQNAGAWSYIGTDNLFIPSDQATMNFGWVETGTVLHEFGHMLGMIHEHQNPRGNRINWDRAKVIKDLSGSPNFWDEGTIEHNMFKRYNEDNINGSQFDPESIMLYSFPQSWTTDGYHTEENSELSDKDKEWASRVYPASPVVIDDDTDEEDEPVTGPVVTELQVIEPYDTDISVAGEEDLYSFEASQNASYVIETFGHTDMVMTLYGPDGKILAQDDDSGSSRNSKIQMSLNPGQYQVQVRHWSKSETGSYSISVKRA